MKPIPSLVPFSWIYEWGIGLRNALYDRKIFHVGRVDVPVISVGNITAGGTGKTPVVELIGKMLMDRNMRAAVVSRGYLRNTRGLVEVSDGHAVKASVGQSGDEPFLLATRLPRVCVVVDEDRVRGAQYASQTLGAEVILLDDGFQHRALHRDLDIVLLEASRLPFSMLMLPAGYRREPMRSLERADAIVVTKIGATTDVESITKGVGRYSAAKIFTSSFSVAGFRRVKTRFSVDIDGLKGKTAVAFCGIGRPDSFRESLEGLGVRVAAFLDYADHHRFSLSDLRQIAKEQKKLAADFVVTTEKDLVRLSAVPANGFLEEVPLYCLEMKTQIHQPREWEEMIEAAIQKK